MKIAKTFGFIEEDNYREGNMHNSKRNGAMITRKCGLVEESRSEGVKKLNWKKGKEMEKSQT